MRTLARPELGRAVLVLLIALAAMVVATAVFGWDATGASYDIVPDPAGARPF